MLLKYRFYRKHYTYKSGQYKIIFLGELFDIEKNYNHFTDVSNFEFLVLLFKELKENMINHLNGIFLIIIEDSVSKRTWIFRDILGLFPFYYYLNEQELLVSDYDLLICKEKKISFSNLNINHLLNHLKIIDYNETIHSKIKKIPFQNYLFVTKNKLSVCKHKTFRNLKSEYLNERETYFKSYNLLKKAIFLRYNLQENNAFHISGGIDSAIIPGIINKKYSLKGQFGFSWSPEKNEINQENLEFDERELVEELCTHFKLTPFFQKNLTVENYYSLKYDPRFYSEAEINILEKAKKQNINRIYSGYGGDEGISSPFFELFLEKIFKFKFKNFWLNKTTNRKKISILIYKCFFPFFGIIPLSEKKQSKNYLFFLTKQYNFYSKKGLKLDFCYKGKNNLLLNKLKCGHLSLNFEGLSYLGEQFNVNYSFPLLDKNIFFFLYSLKPTSLFNFKINRPLLRLIAQKILPLKIANHIRKTDPAINEYINHYYNEKIYTNFKKLKHSDLYKLKDIFRMDDVLFYTSLFESKKISEKEELVYLSTLANILFIIDFHIFYNNFIDEKLKRSNV
ncbi:MAG: hypothetical protein HYU67_12370 [Flavobacteriia bacterium]|nr:hypothetical protein [Flavobacteriia bacterium]